MDKILGAIKTYRKVASHFATRMNKSRGFTYINRCRVEQ
jgi:hypothetical protein